MYGNNVIQLTPSAKRDWRKLVVKGTAPSPRYCHTAAVKNGKIYVFGGYNGSDYFNDLYTYDLTNYTWEKLNSTGPSRTYISETLLILQHELKHNLHHGKINYCCMVVLD